MHNQSSSQKCNNCRSDTPWGSEPVTNATSISEAGKAARTFWQSHCLLRLPPPGAAFPFAPFVVQAPPSAILAYTARRDLSETTCAPDP